MKLRRFGAMMLTLALTLSLAVMPAHALTFSDVDRDFWGYEYITDMSNRGLAKGYDDGTFKPNGRMTAAETLLFCARATGVDSATQTKIANDRKEEVAEILPTSNNMNVWATAEMALAVETGVLSLSELEELSQVDPKTKNAASGERTYLEETMSRENICMYLVRAMQLEPLAKGLGSYSLSYADKDDIAPAFQPYVFVLTNYGIVKGKDAGLFDPKGAVTRAEMTTMLSRALDFMSSAGIVTELSEYTTYDWRGGTITTVTAAADGTIVLGLSNELSGAQSYSIPATAKIYDDNMLTSSTALRAGQYVRLNLNGSGAVQEVRLSGALTTYTGSLAALANGQLTLMVNGVSRQMTIDRFTEVAAAKQVGGRELIDEEAGYTAATCYVDEMGHLAGVRFSGGTVNMDGLVESVTTVNNVTTLGVTAFNGVVYHYSIPAGTTVMVNGILGSLSTAQVGKYVQLRVGADDNVVYSVSVDTVSTFVQGPIRRQSSGNNKGVTIADIFRDNKETSYVVSPSAPITFEGKVLTLSDIQVGWYATVLISNGVVTRMDAFPGSVTVEGTLTSITYGTTTVLQITLEDDSVMSYNLDITDLPAITRGGKNGSIDQLRTGDKVTLTVRYNELERIEAVAQDANLTGVIDRVTQERSGVVLDVTLSDGSKESYTVSDGVSVTQNGAASNIYNLKPGFSVALVTNGDQVVSIEVTAVASSSTEINGTVLLTTNSGSTKTITLQVTNSMGRTDLVVVDVRNANLMSINGNSLNLSNGFASGDTVRAFGAYDGSTFVATIVIKQ